MCCALLLQLPGGVEPTVEAARPHAPRSVAPAARRPPPPALSLADPEGRWMLFLGVDAGEVPPAAPAPPPAAPPDFALTYFPPPAIAPSGEAAFEGDLPVDFRRELVLAWCGLGDSSLVADVFDHLGRGPEALLDGAAMLLHECRSRPELPVWQNGDREPIYARLLDIHMGRREHSLFSDFMANLLDREASFFARFGDSEANTFEFEDGTGEIDNQYFKRKQRSIFWDALKKTYLTKYRFRPVDRIRDDAFSVPSWQGMDYVVMPPLVGAYLYFRGFDKSFSIGDTRLSVSIDPGYRLVRDETAGALGVEWMVKGFPVGFVASVGIVDGEPDLEFIGIGTSLEAARRAFLLNELE